MNSRALFGAAALVVLVVYALESTTAVPRPRERTGVYFTDAERREMKQLVYSAERHRGYRAETVGMRLGTKHTISTKERAINGGVRV